MHLLSSVSCDSQGLPRQPWNTAVNRGVPSRFLLLRYHADRLNAAAVAHGWSVRVSLEQLEKLCDKAVDDRPGSSAEGHSFKVNRMAAPRLRAHLRRH
jgi:hypothetical protein